MQLLLILLFGMTLSANAQPPDSLWSWTYGTPCNDGFYCAKQITDGGFLFGGFIADTSSTWHQDGWLVRTDANGDTLWTRSLGEQGSNQDYIRWVDQTTDEGFIWAGSSGLPDGYWLGKVDADGNVLWEREYLGNYGTNFFSAVSCAEGGYLLVGDGSGLGSDIWVVRVNASGDGLWSRYYGSESDQPEWHCRSVVQTDDGGFLLAGWSGQEWTYKRGKAIRIAPNGDVIWNHDYGLERSQNRFYSVIPSSDGDFYLAGIGDDQLTSGMWLTKISADGDSVWSRIYAHAFCYSAILAPDGGVILAGEMPGPNGHDFAIIKTSASGDSLWSRLFERYYEDEAYSVATTVDGGYVLVGVAETWDWCGEDVNATDACCVLLSSELEIGDQGRSVAQYFELTQNYPNPFNASTTISFDLPREEFVRLNVFDITGRIVATMADEVMEAGAHQVSWDASHVPSGVYMYRLESGSFIQSRKMVVLK